MYVALNRQGRRRGTGRGTEGERESQGGSRRPVDFQPPALLLEKTGTIGGRRVVAEGHQPRRVSPREAVVIGSLPYLNSSRGRLRLTQGTQMTQFRLRIARDEPKQGRDAQGRP